MANNIQLAKKYIGDPTNFNQVFKKGSLTARLDSAAHRINFLNAKTVEIASYGFSTDLMGDYSRANGAPAADIVDTWKSYTLSQDKGNSLYLDVMDDEETLGEGLIRRANEFTRRIIIPGVDKYRFSVLGSVPTPATTPTVIGSKIVSGAASTSADVITRIDTAFEYLAENEVDTDNSILYVTPAFKNLMQNATGITKYFSTQKAHDGDVSTLIQFYNGAEIVEVPSNRLGEDVEFILVQPLAVGTAVKFDETRLINLTDTDATKFGHAWKYRIYYDLFLSVGKGIVEGEGATKTLVNPGVYVFKRND